MQSFTIELPVRITRDKEFGVDHEATQERCIRFRVEAEDEEDALDTFGMLLAGMIDAQDEDFLGAVEPPELLS